MQMSGLAREKRMGSACMGSRHEQLGKSILLESLQKTAHFTNGGKKEKKGVKYTEGRKLTGKKNITPGGRDSELQTFHASALGEEGAGRNGRTLVSGDTQKEEEETNTKPFGVIYGTKSPKRKVGAQGMQCSPTRG